MRKPVTRILLVEDDPTDSRLVLEAIAEIQEGRYRATWAAALDATHVATLEEALAMLAFEAFDAILLDLSLPDSLGLSTYLEVRAAAGNLPVVVIAGSDDEALAISAVREGAQDYLVKTEIDCTRLARSLRYAIERQRLALAVRRLSFVDDLTGLYSMTGFFTLAAHDLELARRLGAGFCLLLTEANGGGDPRMARLETADLLRSALPDTAIIGRLAGDRFAAAVVGVDPAELPGLPPSCGVADLRSAPLASVDDLLAIAENALCENGAGGERSSARRPLVLTLPTA
jgi:DNA-binding response OmpR family regulator